MNGIFTIAGLGNFMNFADNLSCRRILMSFWEGGCPTSKRRSILVLIWIKIQTQHFKEIFTIAGQRQIQNFAPNSINNDYAWGLWAMLTDVCCLRVPECSEHSRSKRSLTFVWPCSRLLQDTRFAVYYPGMEVHYPAIHKNRTVFSRSGNIQGVSKVSGQL